MPCHTAPICNSHFSRQLYKPSSLFVGTLSCHPLGSGTLIPGIILACGCLGTSPPSPSLQMKCLVAPCFNLSSCAINIALILVLSVRTRFAPLLNIFCKMSPLTSSCVFSARTCKETCFSSSLSTDSMSVPSLSASSVVRFCPARNRISAIANYSSTAVLAPATTCGTLELTVLIFSVTSKFTC